MIYFQPRPTPRQNQADRIHGQSHLAFLPFLAREFLDVADEILEKAV